MHDAPEKPSEVTWVHEARLDAFFTDAPAGLAILDDELRYVRINETLARINGRPAREHLGKTVAEMLPTAAAAIEPLLRQVLATGQPVLNVELSGAPQAEAGARTVLASFFPLPRLEGKARQVGAIVVEMTARQQAEEALRRSEQSYREIFNATHEAIYVHDAETGALLDINETVCRMLGWTRAEALQMTPDQGSLGEAPYSAKEAYAWMRKAVEEGPQTFEWHARRKDGSLFWTEISLRCVTLEGKRRILAMVRDVDGRKQAEAALRAQEEKSRALFAKANDAILIADLATGLVVDANQKLAELSGFPLEELRQKHLFEMHHPDERERLRGALEKKIALDQLPPREFRLRHKDGRWIPVEVTAGCFQDVDGRERMFGVMRDITERKRVEAETHAANARLEALVAERTRSLRESQERLTLAQAAGRIGVFDWDMLKDRTVWTPETEAMFGLEPGAFGVSSNQRWAEFLHPDDRERVLALIQESIATKAGARTEFRIVRPDGAIRWIEDIWQVICNEAGQPARMIGVNVDITERKRMEDELRLANRRLELISQITASVVGTGDVGATARRLTAQARDCFEVDACVIRVLEGEEMVLLAAAGTPEDWLPAKLPVFGIARTILESSQPVVIEDVRTHPLTRDLSRPAPGAYTFVSYAGVPLVVQGKVLGLMGLYSERVPRRFTELDLEHLRIVANHTAIILSNERLFEDLRREQGRLEREIAERREVEEALRGSESKFATAFRRAPILMTLSRLEGGRLLEINDAFERVSGYSRAEAIGRTTIELGWVRLADREQCVEELRTRGRIHEREMVCQARNGAEIVARFSAEVVVMDGVPCMITLAEDITERKKLENEREQMNETLEVRVRERTEELDQTVRALTVMTNKYRAAVAATNTGFLVLDETGRVLEANAEYVRLTGRRDLAGILGRQVFEWTAPHDRKRNALEIAKCFSVGMVQNLEVDYLTPEGQIIPIEINAAVVEVEGTRQVVTFCRDITERRRIVSALQDSEERLRTLSANLAEGMVYQIDSGLDGRGRRFTYLSPAVQRLHGLSVEEVMAEPQRIYRQVAEADIARLLEEEIRAQVTEKTLDIEVGMRLPSGELCQRRFISTPRRQPDGRILWNGIELDVTERRRAEEALRESEERFRTLFDNHIDGILVADPASRGFHLSNPAISQMTGYSPEELRQMDVYALHPPEALPLVLSQFHRQVRGEFQLAQDIPVRRKDGTVFYADVNAVSIQLQGRPFLLGSFRDITARKEAEEALQRSEHQLAEAQRIAHLGHWVRDLRTGELTWSEETRRIFGWPAKRKVTYEDLLRALHPEDVPRLLDGQAKALGGLSPIDLEYRMVRPDGQTRHLQVRYEAVRDKDGQVARFDGVVLDITERKRAEEALRQSEAKYRRLHESMTDALVVVSMEGAILECNRAYREMLGYDEEKIRDLTYVQITPKKWHDFEARIVREQILSHGSSGVYEKEYRRKNGTVFPVELRTFLIRNDLGEPAAMWAIVRDITERKRVEQALHDLSAQLLTSQDEERRRLARELHDTTAQELAALVMNLSALQARLRRATAETRQMVADGIALANQGARELRTLSYLLHPPVLDELGLLGAVREYADGFSRRSGIRVDLELPEAMERLPKEMELTLFRVLQESLTNVHRHSGSQTASIRLVLESGQVRLVVRDKGQGLPPEEKAGQARMGVGIRGMQERLRQLGGRLDLKTGKNGTTINAVLPCGAHEA